VLAELDALAAEHPLRETLIARRMRALHAVGRGADALAAYERVRTDLADTLGADPSPELREAHLAVLRAEPEPRPRPATPRLPARLTSFVGRDADLTRIHDLLAGHRLVCLVGPGGAGKTRLAAEVAGAWVRAAPDPVWFVELAPVDAGADLEAVVLGALGLRDLRILDTTATAARGSTERLVEALSGRSGLLVLDNCEHLIGAAATLAALLLAHCPRLRVLATSREPLAIEGETLHWVGPLELPEERAGLAEAEGAAAMRMFVDRAAAARPGFTLDTAGLPAVTEIVRRMDGMPLALELAAARLRSMTPVQVAQRLDDRFRLLTGGSRAALPRHRTLRGVIEWSWELLTEPERRLARRLALFAGGADEAAVLGVCAGGDLPGAEVPYLLASLVEKSLVQTVDGAEGPRYRMLETVRAYGAERLAEAGETESAWAAFLAYFTEYLERVEPGLRTRDQLAAIEQLNTEQDNALAALRHAVEIRDSETGARLAMCMSWFWLLIGRSAEIEPLARAVRESHSGPMSHTVAALTACSLIASAEGGYEIPTQAIDDALTAVRDTEAEERYPLLGLVEPMLAMFLGDWNRAVAAADRASRRADPWAAAAGRMTQLFIAENNGDLEFAEAALAQALPAFRELGERWGLAMCLSVHANFCWLHGRLDEAIEANQEALRLVNELGSVEDTPVQMIWLGRLRVDDRDPDGAYRDLSEALERAEQTGMSEVAMMACCELAKLACTLEDLDQARELLAKADSLRPKVVGLPADHRMVVLALARSVLVECEGDLDGLARVLGEALPMAVRSRDMPVVALVAERIARWRLLRGEPVAAAELLGAAQRLRGVINRGDRMVRETVRRLTGELGDDEYAAAVARGADTDKTGATDRLRQALSLPEFA
jgi:predicted ATPase